MATDNQTIRKEIAAVYNCIAQDFSNTRTKYNIWQSVRNFIEGLSAKSLVADIGCGNGKNMQLRRDELEYIGMDISDEMVTICQTRGYNVTQGDILRIPFADNSVDACMSIAVIHHLTTRAERISAIRELIRITKHGGKLIIYVWAFEQPESSKRKFTSHDEMVPFTNKDGTTHYRYYHLYTDGELLGEVMEANPILNVIDSHMEMGNYVIVAETV